MPAGVIYSQFPAIAGPLKVPPTERDHCGTAKIGDMTSRIAVLAIDALRPDVVAEFWRAVLGWEIAEADPDGISIAPPDRTWPTIDVFAVPEGKSVKNRLHLDLRADGCSTVEELQRLLDLGARRVDVGQATDVSWVVLADPEGNEFCLLAGTVQDVLN
jgi:predicted enzyme related to lactoylglutathione lyase